MSIRGKIFAVLLMVVVVATAAFIINVAFASGINRSLRAIDELNMPLTQHILTYRGWMERRRMHMRTLLQTRLPAGDRRTQRTRLDEAAQLGRESLASVDKTFEQSHALGLAAPQTEAAWLEVEAELTKLEAITGDLFRLFDEWDQSNFPEPNRVVTDFATFRGDHYALAARLGGMMGEGRVSGPEITGVPADCAFGKWHNSFQESLRIYQSNQDPDALITLADGSPGMEFVKNKSTRDQVEKINAAHDAFHNAARDTYSSIAAGNMEMAGAYFRDMNRDMNTVIEGIAAISREAGLIVDKSGEARDILMNTLLPMQNTVFEKLDIAIHTNETESSAQILEAISDGRSGLLIAIGIAVIGLLAAGAVAYIIVSRIIASLHAVIVNLSETSARVSGMAEQIAETSENLANGAIEQASNVESSSAALEEMASMTKLNAENSARTAETTNKTMTLISDGSSAVHSMSQAMGEISDSAEKISHIIKTIEEIAFQTNLLALNAAVESARAGEAGLGFAVVADEVRNLAQRSAQAARDTADLIDGTIARVKNGSAIATTLDSSFKNIEDGAKDVGQLVSEISGATADQAKGVELVNESVGQVDKVTQSNAATAEECSANAELLSTQAEELREMIDELTVVVSGEGAKAAPARAKKSQKKRASSTQAREASQALQLAAPAF